MERHAPLAVYASLVAYFHSQTDGFQQNDILSYCTMKSAPILTLAAMAYTGAPRRKRQLRRRFALGLLFGGIGDFLLSTGELGFCAGAISFAISHIFNIAYFGTYLYELSYGVSAACVLYAIAINHFFIFPWLASMPVALIVLAAYSFVICAAVIVAGSLLVNGSRYGHRGKEFRTLAAGYALFFISDTLLLLERFDFVIWPHAGAVVLLSYYAAQYLLFANAHSVRIDVAAL